MQGEEGEDFFFSVLISFNFPIVLSHSFLQGNLTHPGIEPRSPARQADSLPSHPPGKPLK